jgi:hypothetical protein
MQVALLESPATMPASLKSEHCGQCLDYLASHLGLLILEIAHH